MRLQTWGCSVAGAANHHWLGILTWFKIWGCTREMPAISGLATLTTVTPGPSSALEVAQLGSDEF